MKIRIFALMIALISVFSCVCAQECGNLNNGGFVLTESEIVYLADGEGLWMLKPGQEPVKIEDGPVSMLQIYDGRLYYLKDSYVTDEYGYEELDEQTPFSCLLDGTDKTKIGSPLAVGSNFEFINDYMVVDSFIGYKNFTVYDGSIYYLSNSGIPGEYVCTADYGDGEEPLSVTGEYKSGIALYKSDLNGENTRALTGVIGNSVAAMAIENDKIYLAAGYQDTIFAYSYVNYSILSLEGEVLCEYKNTQKDTALPFKSDAGEFYHNTEAVIPYGDNMLVSLSDSEGDFVASQLFELDPEGNLTQIAIEQQFVPSVLSDGILYYVGSASQSTFYDETINYQDSFGIYRKGVDEEGDGVKLCSVQYGGYSFDMRLAVSGGYVYFKGETGEIYRAHTETGAVEQVK